jgi:hypothetical protein
VTASHAVAALPSEWDDVRSPWNYPIDELAGVVLDSSTVS